MFHKAKPTLAQMFCYPYWRISTAFLIISTISLLSFWAAPGRLDAINGITPDRPFGVELNETLISLDLNANGVIDAGDRREVSGYTFTIHSDKAFTSLNKLTLTFPAGIDLVDANYTLANYELYEPVDKKFVFCFNL